MSNKQGVQLTAEQNEKIRAALAAMDAEYQEVAREAAELAAEERAKPVEKSERWWSAYYRLENTFLHEVREAMAADGLSPADLARLLGVSRARVSQILNGGEENFKLETIAKLATALDRGIGFRLLRKGESIHVAGTQDDRAALMSGLMTPPGTHSRMATIVNLYEPEPACLLGPLPAANDERQTG